MSDALYLDIALRVKDQATALIQKFAGTLGSINPVLGAVGGIAIGTGVAIAGVGIASVKMASDYQGATLSLVAHAGLAQSQLDNVTKSVLAMAPAVGRSPTELAEALYPILSAFSGIQNQAAKSALSLDTLKMSFQTVAGTTVNGTQVAQAAVGTFNALGLATNNVGENTRRMTNLFDVMDKTVQIGNMQWDQYKNVISKLAVSIKGTSITFNEASAALAEMTNMGYSARLAQTYLSNTFTTLAIKTDALAKHAKKLGISFNEPAYASMDLAHKIEYLNQITDGNKQKVLALLNNNTVALKTFNALSTGIDGYRSNLDSLNHSQGALAQSFATASQGFGFQMNQIKHAGDALMITLGQQLLPVLSQLLAAIVPIITNFTTWLSQSGFLTDAVRGLGQAFWRLGSFLQPVAQGFQFMVNTVGGAFRSMANQTSQSMLQMRLNAASQSAQQAQEVIDNIEKEKRGILDEMANTHNAVFRKTLEMHIQVLNATEKHTQNIVKQAQKQKQGIVNQLVSTDLEAQLLGAKIADGVKNRAVEGAARTIAAYEQMKRGIEQQLKQTHDIVKKHALQMQLASVNLTLQGQQGDLQKLIKERNDIEKQMAAIHAAMKQSVLDKSSANTVGHLGDMFNKVGAAIMKGLGPSFQQFGKILQENMPQIQLFAQLMGGIVLGVLGILIAVFGGLVRGAAQFALGVTVAVTGVIQFFNGFIEFLAGFLGRFADLFTGNTTQLTEDTETMTKGIMDILNGLYKIFFGSFQALFDSVSGIASGFADTIIAYFQGLADTLVGHSIIPDMINSIINWFKSLPSKVGDAIQGFVKSVGDQFSTMATDAIQWGKNLITNFISGLKSVSGGAVNILHTLHVPGFAAGVRNFAGGYAVVGEQGPELVYLPSGSSVYPGAGASSSLGSSASGGTGLTIQNVNISVNDFSANMPRSVANALADALDPILGQRLKGQLNGVQQGGW